MIYRYDFGQLKGFLAENAVLNELLCAGRGPVFTWRGTTAEIEFLLAVGEQIIPIEVKAGVNTKAKLHAFPGGTDSTPSENEPMACPLAACPLAALPSPSPPVGMSELSTRMAELCTLHSGYIYGKVGKCEVDSQLEEDHRVRPVQ